MGEKIKAMQIRFPMPIYNALKAKAKENRRSLNAETLVCLEKVLEENAAAISEVNQGKVNE